MPELVMPTEYNAQPAGTAESVHKLSLQVSAAEDKTERHRKQTNNIANMRSGASGMESKVEKANNHQISCWW